MDDDARQKVALFRLSVLGPLISARLEHGDRQSYFEEAAARVQEHPSGRFVRVSPRTVESWFYAYKRGGFSALFPGERIDRGISRAIRPELAEIIVRAKREKPRRSLRRIIRALERAHIARPGELSRSSVHRLLAAYGISARPLRGPAAERRSFLHEHAGDLWIGDALHGPVVAWPSGPPRKAYLLSQIDCATRHLVHSFFAPSEGAVEQERGFRAAIEKAGVPRAYYVDLGSAYIADSLKLICAELGIRLLHAGAGDAEAKGAIERWHRTWREEVEDELDDRLYASGDLSLTHAAWLAEEYERRVHETTGRAPGEHWLSEIEHLRPVPRDKDLVEVFLHRGRRTVRKDGTVRFHGKYLEVRAELAGEIELRFDPTDPARLPRVFVAGEPGVGKTAAIRNLCLRLPKPDYLVIYLSDTAVSPLDLYRTLAIELGVRPSHRRAQLWTDIKKALVHLVDERSTAPVVMIDEAQHLSDKFLLDLSGFLNFTFDSRDLLTMWLVGLPELKKTLARQEHVPLATRVAAAVHFEPFIDKDAFGAAIAASLAAVGAGQKILAEPALDLLFRQSRGFLRVAARLLRSALRLAHDRDQSFVDEPTMALAVDELFAPAPLTQKP